MPELPSRLLEAIAQALLQDVSPHIDDEFAQMQCRAAAELLGNLAGELDWAAEPIRARDQALREILAALTRSGWDAWRARSAPGADVPAAQARATLLAELGDGLRWLGEHDPVATAEVDALLRADLQREVDALRRGMFG